MLVEICVRGIRSALAAERGGADRIELCEDLAVGGVTPGAGTISLVCQRLTIPVHVIVRPRGGDFVHDDDELDSMLRDIAIIKSLGASGAVFGLLDAQGRVDPRTSRLVEASRPMSVTFHKAFDEAADPIEAMETLIDLGVDRILTSGQAPSAIEGIELLETLVREASGKITILAAGRIRLDEIPRLLDAGLSEIHLGSAACERDETVDARVRRIVEEARTCERS